MLALVFTPFCASLAVYLTSLTMSLGSICYLKPCSPRYSTIQKQLSVSFDCHQTLYFGHGKVILTILTKNRLSIQQDASHFTKNYMIESAHEEFSQAVY